ncbi:hypothetical protein B0H16DRAFT_1478600 [Mycena metata]|uniref:Uncharacterized protein n=1 Tax=Mycena metata TaxID=1033252 RepID=A0AAD7H6D5_9AGAR|nr:hypothetical protein B0H16DRAFT_1478600 [Mycena metata]
MTTSERTGKSDRKAMQRKIAETYLDIEDFDTGTGSSLDLSGRANGSAIGRGPDDGGGEIGDGSTNGRAQGVRRSQRNAGRGGNSSNRNAAAGRTQPHNNPRPARQGRDNTSSATRAQPTVQARPPRRSQRPTSPATENNSNTSNEGSSASTPQAANRRRQNGRHSMTSTIQHTSARRRQTSFFNRKRKLQQEGNPKIKRNTRAQVKLAALNINGRYMKNKDDKWPHLSCMMFDERIGIMAVGETHLTEAQIEEIESAVGGRNRLRIFSSIDPDHPNKGGVAVVLNKDITNIENIQFMEFAVKTGSQMFGEETANPPESIQVNFKKFKDVVGAYAKVRASQSIGALEQKKLKLQNERENLLNNKRPNGAAVSVPPAEHSPERDSIKRGEQQHIRWGNCQDDTRKRDCGGGKKAKRNK